MSVGLADDSSKMKGKQCSSVPLVQCGGGSNVGDNMRKCHLEIVREADVSQMCPF